MSDGLAELRVPKSLGHVTVHAENLIGLLDVVFTNPDY